MVLKLYNTLSRKKEVFKPIEKGKVRMYVCGPTVQGPAHIGHARTYIAFDVLRRYLEYSGYKVKYVMNLTDVHDDIIKVANQQGKTMFEVADTYIPIFFRDLDTLKIKSADVYPRVTETIKEIVDIVKILEQKGFAYEREGSVYFDISKFKDYGKFARVKIDKVKIGVRVDTDKYDKESPMDFALWKAKKKGEPYWDSPWGQGRPGWHIECSVMSIKYLGKQIDIHGGARDLIFPHHQNEIAQSEAATGKKPFVKYWIHTGFLNVEGEKMSKSLGNYIEVPDLLAKYDVNSVRFFMVSTHYKSPIDFSEKNMDYAKNSLDRLNNFITELRSVKQGKDNNKVEDLIKKTKEKFVESMDDDLNTAKALASIFDLAKKVNIFIKDKKISKENAESVLSFLKEINIIFDFMTFEEEKLPKKLMDLIQKREKARKQKNYKLADKLRKELKQKGIILEDTKEGVRWKRV